MYIILGMCTFILCKISSFSSIYDILECKYEMCKCRFLHQHTCNYIFQEEEEGDTEVEENKGEEGEEGKVEERGKEEE